MREIKFRGKRLDNGEWIYGYYGHKEASDQHFIMVETMNLHHDWTYFTDYEVDPETVGQHTGLKDKNGKEIYEGDILECFTSGPSVIEFNGGLFGLKNKVEGFVPFNYLYGDVEVLGNIYENPELLKGEESE